MKKTILRKIFNRIIHLLARFCPGTCKVRPFLHNLRGLKHMVKLPSGMKSN